jgi:hypothetical protein
MVREELDVRDMKVTEEEEGEHGKEKKGGN